MFRVTRRLLAGGLAVAFAVPLTAQAPVHFKLATLAPESAGGDADHCRPRED